MADTNDDNKSNSGFTTMSDSKQRKIASKGGKASHGGNGSSSRQSGHGSDLSEEDRRGGGVASHKNG